MLELQLLYQKIKYLRFDDESLKKMYIKICEMQSKMRIKIQKFSFG